MRKGQSSTEFMVLLMLVLIILGIIVAVYADIPSIFYSQDVKSSRLYWENADISIENLGVANATIKITIKNNLLNPIYINNITIGNFTQDTALNLSVAEEESDTFFLPDNPSSGYNAGEYDVDVYNLREGQRYKLDIKFGYTNLLNERNYTYVGQVAYVGIIANSLS